MSTAPGGWQAELLTGDFHVHTDVSDDAHSPLADCLAAAIARGLRVVRITDHVRVDSTWLPRRAALLAAAAQSGIASELQVLPGFETKLLDVVGHLDAPPHLLLTAPQHLVIADHQVPTPTGPWSPRHTREAMAAGLPPATVLAWLIGSYLAVMHRHPGAQLAHPFSILPKIGLAESDLTAQQVADWAGTAARTGTTIEVNEKWGCPAPSTIAAARRAGARLVASSDAHEAGDVGRYARVPALLAEAADA
ncbi:PHP domain-containing protein [Serinibacter salmoneus]|uniref:Putative hydrolase n=1 Tax=Serinibacter salmoneus TaxID=556530 RepID=A0A2A9D2J3_9MICO|nr:PHP domain-containing protein [Serinibacter salmoneus]PFG20938.1 putative hydrolase [Serinibacter salmoneus]